MEVSSALINYCRLGEIEDVKYILSNYSLSEYPEWSGGYWLICEALKKRKMEIVKLLLQSGAKVNIERNVRSKSNTPLHHAIRIESMEIIEILLDKNADINARNKNEKTPLHVAIVRQNEEIVKLLLSKGANVDLLDKYGHTSLHLAARNGDVKIVQHLLNYNADVNFSCTDFTALYFALESKNPDIVKLLIQNGAIVNSNYSAYYDFLQLAVDLNNEEIMRLLLEKGNGVDRKEGEASTVISNIVEKKETKISENLSEIMDFSTASGNEVLKTDDELELTVSKQMETQISENTNDNVLLGETRLSEQGKITKKNISALLHTALTLRQEKVVKLFLNYGFDANARNEFGRTPMYYAYKYNDLDMCQHLLANGACINTKIDSNLNLLHAAVEKRDERVVHFLLEEGADINATTNERCTALHIACREGHELIVQLLLKHNIDVHLKDNMGFTALHEAVRRGEKRIVKRLLLQGSNVNDITNSMLTPLHFAAVNGQRSIVQLLLKYGADVNAMDNNCANALSYAVRSGDTSIVHFLLEKDLNVDEKSNKLAFCLAILGNLGEHNYIVDIFLMRGFTINSEDFDDFPIPNFLYSEYLNDYKREIYRDILKGLLKRVPSTTAFLEYMILRSSVEKGFVRIVKSLLRYDVNVNILLEKSCTLLHIAIENGQFWIAEELLKRGANVNARDIRGRTPLHVSVLNNFTDVVAFLLKYNVDVEARDEDGKTALHLASDGKYHITKLILDAGANINSTSNNESTPLHIATENGHKEVVELLLDYDAETQVKSRSYQTPLDIAICWQRTEIANVLIEHGAVHSITSISSFSEDINELVMKHSMKLQALCMDSTEINSGDVFISRCDAEVKKMIGHSVEAGVSLYDVLTKKDYQVEKYMKNKSIFNFFDYGDFECSYPIYASILKMRFKKAKTRNLLIEQASNTLEHIVKIRIPHLVIQKILSFLDNLDLRNLIHVT